MKKVLSFLLAIMVCFTCGISAFAANSPTPDRYYTVDAEDMTLRFTCSSQLVENNRIASIAVQIGQNQPIYDNKGYQFGEEIVFDFIDTLQLRIYRNYTILITLYHIL